MNSPEHQAAQERQWAEWMRAAQAGDALCYRRLLESVAPFVRSLVRRYHRRPTLVEDAVQEVLLTMHRVRHTWDPARAFSPWLAAIAARRAIDLLRRESRIGRHETHDEEAYETFASPAANHDAGAVGAAAEITPLLALLTPSQRSALEAVKLRGLSVADAATEAGTSVSAVKVNIHRAVARLRQLAGLDSERQS